MFHFGTNRGKNECLDVPRHFICILTFSLISAAMTKASKYGLLVCMTCPQPKHGWVPKGTGEALAHKREGAVKQRVCSVEGGEGPGVLKPVTAKGRPGWKGRIWRLKEISCADDHKKKLCKIREESYLLN